MTLLTIVGLFTLVVLAYWYGRIEGLNENQRAEFTRGYNEGYDVAVKLFDQTSSQSKDETVKSYEDLDHAV